MHNMHTHAVQDPSVTAATSAQPGTGQDDYNPFADEGPPEKQPEVKEVVSTISCIAETMHKYADQRR